MDGSEDDPEELTRVQEDALWAEFVGSDRGAARIRERLAGSDDLLNAIDILINFVAETVLRLRCSPLGIRRRHACQKKIAPC